MFIPNGNTNNDGIDREREEKREILDETTIS
jgi:hypothetical protein